MRSLPKLLALFSLATVSLAQAPRSVTVPITLDHNRVVIDVHVPLPDGTTKRVRAWVDTGTSEMMMSQRTAALFGPVSCDAQTCTATPPAELLIGGLKISLADAKTAHAPAGLPKDVMIPGMSPEINLPSTILRSHDVVFDYANRQFTIGDAGSVKFKGNPSKARINSLGLIQVTSNFEGEDRKLSLDTGASISFIATDLFSKWRSAHPAWPYLKGSIGAANMFGAPDEPERQLLLVPSLQFGSSTLRNVLVANLPLDLLKRLSDRAGVETGGLLGGDAFRNHRVGIDYAHNTIYVDAVTAAPAPALDGVGLTLRPEPDGRFTILAVLEVDGKPSVPEVKPGDVLLGIDGAPATGATLGQVWSLLGGSPGQTRALTLEREGKRFTVDAPVRRFLTASGTPVKSPRRNPHKRN